MVEVIVALTISAMLLVSVVSTTRALSSTRQNVERRVDQGAAARHAMETIVAALRNIRRDPTMQRPVVIGRSGGRGAGNDRIDLLVISDVRGRPEGAESDQYEQSFYLTECPGRAGLVLLSRKDHALDDHPQEGGVGTIVAEGMTTLSFAYYSGAEWRDEWSDLEVRAPEAVRITLATVPTSAAADAKGFVEPVVLSPIVALHANEPVDDQAADRTRREEANQNPNPTPTPGGPPQ
jgi:type II secretory pathway component PulJ